MTTRTRDGNPKTDRADPQDAPSSGGPTVVALTGTPGTGKTSVADVLAGRGHGVLALNRFVCDPRFDLGSDPDRAGTVVLDEEALADYLQEDLAARLGEGVKAPFFIESHFAHTLGFVDRIIVLRCRPSILKERLQRRGYPEEKIRENMEVEGLDLILQEALHTRDEQRRTGRVIGLAEVDTSEAGVDETAREVLRLATTASTNLEIGRVDWSDEVLGWY